MCGVPGGGSMRGSTACSLDREVVAEQPAEVVDTDVVRRVEAPRLHVLAVLVVEVVVDGEQQPARAHGVEQRPHRGLAGGLGQRRVLHRHEVERAGRERCLQGIPADPLDRGAGRLGGLPRPADGDIGDVDRSDRPAAPGEPDRVGALTTTDVERPARGEVGDLGDEPPVRPPAPHCPVALAVPRVPLGGLRRRPNRCSPPSCSCMVRTVGRHPHDARPLDPAR